MVTMILRENFPHMRLICRTKIPEFRVLETRLILCSYLSNKTLVV